MTHAIVSTVSSLVYEGNIDSAERALATVADAEGDYALARVIDEMPSRDVVAILREHDSSRSSIISELISPKAFLAAVVLEREYRERNHESLKGMINSVVFADEDRTDEFIESLGSTADGVSALADYFSERHEEVEYFFRNGTYSQLEGDESAGIPTSNADLDLGDPGDYQRGEIVALREVQDQDWRELSWRLRCEHYEIFREVLEVLRMRHQRSLEVPVAPPKSAQAQALDDDDDEDDVL